MPTNSDIITATIRDFSRISGLGNTSIYQLLNDGEIESVTSGRRRLILIASYHQYLDRQRGTPAAAPVASPPHPKRRSRIAAGEAA
jgi:hypothetical protein